MPNDVTQQLTIRGAEFAGVIGTIAGDRELFDFNQVIPMPDELRIEESTKGDMGVAVLTGHVHEYLDRSWVKQRGIATPEAFVAYVRDQQADALQLGRTYLNNERKFGFRSWYEWCIHNWGTKWNAYNVTQPDISADQAVLRYETAWTAAIPVIERLSDRFPGTEFILKYIDDGWTYAGTTHVLAGQIFDDCFEPDPSDGETHALYHDIFGEHLRAGRFSFQHQNGQTGNPNRCKLSRSNVS